MSQEYLAIRVDEEYAAPLWWDALREKYPAIAASLTHFGHAVVTDEVWDVLSSLPDFACGPTYAPTALIDGGCESEMWIEVTSCLHHVFEEAR